MQDGKSGIDSSDLFWYRKRSCDGMVENLGPGTGKQEATNAEKIHLLGIANLNQAPFSEEMPGEYWCQAVITNSSGQYLATRSNVLTVLRPENYTGLAVCSSVPYTSAVMCAYPPVSSTCTVPCISEEPIVTTCVQPIPTMEESSTHSPIKSSFLTKGWNSSTTSSVSVNNISEEETNSNMQPVSASKSTYFPVTSMLVLY